MSGSKFEVVLRLERCGIRESGYFVGNSIPVDYDDKFFTTVITSTHNLGEKSLGTTSLSIVTR